MDILGSLKRMVTGENRRSNQIEAGDAVLLWFDDGRSYLVRAEKGKKHSIHCGRPLLCDDWIGASWGSRVDATHGTAYLLRPSTEDLMMKASRESGIIYPKDAAYLSIKLGILSGQKVLEIGTGSGSLTMHLARTVQPHGEVHTFDRRTDLPKNAVKNLERAGLMPYVYFHQRQAEEPLPEGDFDAAVLDIPEPWAEIAIVKKALKSGGRLCALNPTMNQIEKSAEALRKNGFILVECIELLERPILAREGKTRPVQRMVSHTEYMVFGVKVDDAGGEDNADSKVSDEVTAV